MGKDCKGKAFWSMVALRAAMLGLVIAFVAREQLNVMAMYLPIFLVTAPLLIIGWRDDEYAWLDVGITAIFVLALLNTMFLSWPDYHSLWSYDKIFHAAGGAWLAAFAAVLLRKQGWVRSRPAAFVAVIGFALLIGALWEVFEWLLTLLPEPFYTANTGFADAMMDMVADAAGTLVAAVTLSLRRYL